MYFNPRVNLKYHRARPTAQEIWVFGMVDTGQSPALGVMVTVPRPISSDAAADYAAAPPEWHRFPQRFMGSIQVCAAVGTSCTTPHGQPLLELR